MPKYTQEQDKILDKIKGYIQQLAKIEILQKRRYQTQFGVEGALDSDEADLELENYPSYDTLEGKLKEDIALAKKLNLAKDPLVIKVTELAFSS